MRHQDVHLVRELHEPEDFETSDIVHTTNPLVIGSIAIVWRKLEMSSFEVVVSEDARNAADPNSVYVDHPSVAEIIDVRGSPPSISEFLEIVRCFVVAADEYRQDRSNFLSAVVSKMEKTLISSFA